MRSRATACSVCIPTPCIMRKDRNRFVYKGVSSAMEIYSRFWLLMQERRQRNPGQTLRRQRQGAMWEGVRFPPVIPTWLKELRGQRPVLEVVSEDRPKDGRPPLDRAA